MTHDGMDRSLVEVGKGGTRDASTLVMRTVLAEELKGSGRDGRRGDALVVVPGHVDQAVKPRLGGVGGRKEGRLRNLRSGGGGVVDGVVGVGDKGGGIGDVMGGSHDTSNVLDEMNYKHDHQTQIN